ncbi:SH3 domain-containing protein [Biscogniauxia sp. FL1348]|nr:SH3 domain-containing protein [Biscogniauxia sp. FL1348]
MQSMQRQFGRMLHKSPGDNAKVAVILSDYEDADRILAKIIEQTKSWRDSWVNLASSQLGIVVEYDGLWDPIVGATDGHGKPVVPTPELQLERTLHLKQAYTELKTELMEEIEHIELRIIRPATDARDCIAPMRKTIKKRENKRLDWEKCQDKSTKLQRKSGRTAKEDASLAKAEAEVARTAEDFHAADAHLRETLPPLVNATFSIVPPLLNAVVLVQNRLLGIYYTALHNYCQDYNFPSPAPPMEDVIATFSADYEPVKREAESISFLASGKAVRMPMKLPDDPSAVQEQRRPSNASNVSAENGLIRRPSAGLISSNINAPPPVTGLRPNRIPSTTSLASQASSGSQSRPTIGSNYTTANNHLAPTDFTTASRLGGQAIASPATSPSSVRSRADYFSGGRSPPGSRPVTAATASGAAASPAAALAAAASKKKPPPPPPPKPKRIASTKPDEFVIAQYDFEGQGEGDLSFREGDRIRIVKKTGTDQDWWIGELGGARGSFPANYCRAA